MRNSIRIPFRRKFLRGPGFLHSNPLLAALGCSLNFIERFWSKVIKTESCWIWTGARNKQGHGRIALGGKGYIYAHRASWILHRGAIPSGKEVLHHCPHGDDARCVNPSHLYLGTQVENLLDAYASGRKRLRGELGPGSKLTDAEAQQIKREYKPRIVTAQILGRKFGVSRHTIRGIIYGKHYNSDFPQKPDRFS